MLGRMPHPYGEAEARSFVATSKLAGLGGVVYALTLADNGALVGCAGLTRNERGLELGYWIGEPHWGKGYATEAAHALVDLAFRVTEINTLHASCRIIAGKVPIERYRLDRRTWSSLRSWARS
jgi:RimJ/RimL family protein N-acetyltransferase